MTNEEMLFWLDNWFSDYPNNTQETQKDMMLDIINDNQVAFLAFIKSFRTELVEASQTKLEASLAAGVIELAVIEGL